MSLDMLHRFLFAAGLVCVLSAAVACSSTPDQTEQHTEQVEAPADEDAAHELFVRANEALDAGQWDRAVDLYLDTVELDPTRWDADMNRGIALAQLGEYDNAVDAFADALEHGGDVEPLVYFNLGNLYQRRSLYEASIDAYRTSLAYRDELDYATLLNLSASYTFLNAFDEAEETIDRAMQIDPDDPRGPLTRGLIVLSQENPDGALDIYDELVAMHPEFPPARYNRGFVLLRLGELEQARREFATYLDLAPQGPFVQKAESHLSSIEQRLERN